MKNRTAMAAGLVVMTAGFAAQSASASFLHVDAIAIDGMPVGNEGIAGTFLAEPGSTVTFGVFVRNDSIMTQDNSEFAPVFSFAVGFAEVGPFGTITSDLGSTIAGGLGNTVTEEFIGTNGINLQTFQLPLGGIDTSFGNEGYLFTFDFEIAEGADQIEEPFFAYDTFANGDGISNQVFVATDPDGGFSSESIDFTIGSGDVIVTPTPGAAGTLVIAGLAATRRRRA